MEIEIMKAKHYKAKRTMKVMSDRKKRKELRNRVRGKEK